MIFPILDYMINPVDEWILNLTEAFNGFGMLIYLAIVLSLSAILSSIIGLERYRNGKSAGMRTHALLAVGACFMMAVSIWAIRIPTPGRNYDVSRIAASVVTGIGFLGAGVIVKNKLTIRGLSTATTLWVSAAIGLGLGAGFVLEAIVVAFITTLVTFVRKAVIHKVDTKAPHVVIVAKRGTSVLKIAESIAAENDLAVTYVTIHSMDEKTVTAYAYFPYHINVHNLEYYADEIKKNADVLETKVNAKTAEKF